MAPLGVPLGLFVKKWYLKVGLAGYDILNDITKVSQNMFLINIIESI